MEASENKYREINGLSPAYPVHPGSLLAEELEARGIKKKDFAAQIGIQATHLSALLHGKRDVTPAIAVKLEKGLNIPAVFWLKYQQKYNLDTKRNYLRTSSLVAGYHNWGQMPEPVLAEPAADYGGKLRVIISIPMQDKDLLEMLVSRLGWGIE